MCGHHAMRDPREQIQGAVTHREADVIIGSDEVPDGVVPNVEVVGCGALG